MDTATKIAHRTLLSAGGLALGLGMLVWAGVTQVGGFHVILGILVVLSLWVLCVIAMRARVSRAAIALAAAWGVIVASLGIMQEQLVPGDWHWTIRLAHLVISMGAMWWGNRLVILMRRSAAPAHRGPARGFATLTTMEPARTGSPRSSLQRGGTP